MTPENFDYSKAVKELEEIAKKVEDPETSIEDIDKFIARSAELVEQCRSYLRSAREKVEKL